MHDTHIKSKVEINTQLVVVCLLTDNLIDCERSWPAEDGAG